MAERTKFGRTAVTVLELDLDTCAREYGTSPCNALGPQYAVQFDGVNDYVTVPDSASLDTGSVTVETWFKLTGTLDCDANNNYRSFIRKGFVASTPTGWDIVLEQNGGFTWDTGFGVTSRLSVPPVLTVGVAVHLVSTYDAATGYKAVYKNGALIAEVTLAPAAITENALPVDIARGNNAVACPFGDGYTPGIFDGVRIYSRALTAAEVLEHYQGVYTNEAGLVLHLPFNEGTGTAASDVSGNANHGTLVNGPTWVGGIAWVDRSGACYNTYKTCQDKTNYVKTTKTHKFTNRGAPIPPGELHRPYITTRGIKDAPTEIDPEAGLARRAMVTANMVDETDADIDTDPYVRNRAAPAQGTYWARLLARSPHYVGRFARLRRGFATTPWNWAEFTDELYVIDQIKGPDRGGAVQVILKDPIKLTDRTKVPAPTSGKLAAALALDDMQLELDALSGAQYPANGYVRRGDEVIRYAHKHVKNGWNFSDNINEGFTTANAAIATGVDAITLTASAADPNLRKGGLSLAGGTWRYLAARIRQLVAGTWQGQVFYNTSGHGESAAYFAQATEPALLASGEWVTVVWDMHNLAAGGNDWIDNTITGIRLDLASTINASYEIDWVAYSTSSEAEADLLVWPNGTYRAQFLTSAQAGKAGDGVQLCKVYLDAPVSTVVQDLLNAAGLDNAYIDLVQLAAEDATWLAEKYRITICLSEPEDVSVYLAEICKVAGAVLWWLPIAQKVKFKVIGPRAPNEGLGTALNDEANLIGESVTVAQLDDLRITLAAIYYDLVSATANRRETKNYLTGVLYEDANAEGPNEYNDQRMRVETTRWSGAANASAVKSRVNRLLAYYRDAPKQIDFAVDPKDGDRVVGDLVPLITAGITDFAGAPEAQKVLITRRTDNEDGRVQYSARTTVFNRRYAFVAPAGHPDYLVATEDQRAYAYICSAAGKMSNGDDGYLII